MSQEWRLEAACLKVDPDLPFAPPGSSDAGWFASVVCGNCPVRRECLDHALEREDLGIYGGLTPQERGRVKAGRTRQLKPCGTASAYHRHLARDEEPCGPCRAANNAYRRDNYRPKVSA